MSELDLKKKMDFFIDFIVHEDYRVFVPTDLYGVKHGEIDVEMYTEEVARDFYNFLTNHPEMLEEYVDTYWREEVDDLIGEIGAVRLELSMTEGDNMFTIFLTPVSIFGD